MSATNDAVHVARVGLGVTDLAIGARFYEAVGFTASPAFDLGTAIADQSEVPGSPLVIQIVRRAGVDLELVQHGGARPPGRPPARRPMNQLGLSHLTFVVDDLEASIATIESVGGWSLPITASAALGARSMFCTDPFGIRLLVVEGETALAGAAEDGAACSLAHIGMSVADLDATRPFWTALGFDVGDVVEHGDSFGPAAELDGLALATMSVSSGPFRFVAYQWGPARPAGYPVRLPLNRNGDLIHLGTHCEDWDRTIARVVQAGGIVNERTRAVFPAPALEMPWEGEPHGWVFVLDPNGIEVEIVGPRTG